MHLLRKIQTKNHPHTLQLLLLPFVIFGSVLASCNLVDSGNDVQEKTVINGTPHFQKNGVWYATFKGVDYQVDTDVITVKMNYPVAETSGYPSIPHGHRTISTFGLKRPEIYPYGCDLSRP